MRKEFIETRYFGIEGGEREEVLNQFNKLKNIISILTIGLPQEYIEYGAESFEDDDDRVVYSYSVWVPMSKDKYETAKEIANDRNLYYLTTNITEE